MPTAGRSASRPARAIVIPLLLTGGRRDVASWSSADLDALLEAVECGELDTARRTQEPAAVPALRTGNLL